MTLQDFLAASPGDERLAWARWLCFTCGFVCDNMALTVKPSDLTGSGVDSVDENEPNWFYVADAVLAELARQREADKARIGELEDQLESYHFGNC